MDAFGDIHSSRALVLITDLFLSFVFNYRNVLIIKNVCCVLSHSVVSDSAASWTVACQTPLSTGILQARILEWVAMSFSRGSL